MNPTTTDPERGGETPSTRPGTSSVAPVAPPASGAPQNPLPRPPSPSPEEQMAAYEDALKEEDWGHQPC